VEPAGEETRGTSGAASCVRLIPASWTPQLHMTYSLVKTWLEAS
jgi:hypothetical protein